MVTLRTAVVLDARTPAMKRLTALVRFGLGGRIGTGRQWVSWLHVADFQAIIRASLEGDQLAGVVHATSPNPVTNAELMSELRRAPHRPAAPPTPALMLRAGSALLRSDPALALTGRRCVPGSLLKAGFEFSYPELGPALSDLLSR
jgi:NAD dependent epimerase/dehydratase family enzyme